MATTNVSRFHILIPAAVATMARAVIAVAVGVLGWVRDTFFDIALRCASAFASEPPRHPTDSPSLIDFARAKGFLARIERRAESHQWRTRPAT